MESAHRGSIGAAAAGWVAGAAVLRLARAPARWDEPVFDYASYHLPFADALARGDFVALTHTFAGLHPPLYSLLFTALNRTWSAPLGWLLLSAAFSTAAVWMTARAAALAWGPRGATLAAAWMAVAPAQLAYAAEVNDYPLLSAAIAALLWAEGASRRAGRGGRAEPPTVGVIAAGTVAAWTHAMGGVAAVAGLAASPGSRRRRIAGLLMLGLLTTPLWSAAWRLAGEPGTFRQPALPMTARLELLGTRFGWPAGVTAGLAVVALVLPGVVRRADQAARAPLAVLVAVTGTLGVFLEAGVAAPHQFPYLVALGPPAAMLVAAAFSRVTAAPEAATARNVSLEAARGAAAPEASAPGAAWGGTAVRLAALLALAGLGLVAFGREARGLEALLGDQAQPRAIDGAVGATRPGDGLWLVTPYRPDDDKTLTSPVLWRLPPWEPMPAARPFHFDPLNFRYGTPRAWRGVTVYMFTRVFPGPMREILAHHLGKGASIQIVAYDLGREPHLGEELAALLAGYTVEVRRFPRAGEVPELWYRVEGRR